MLCFLIEGNFPGQSPTEKDVTMINPQREKLESALEQTRLTSERQALLKQLWKLGNTNVRKEKNKTQKGAECVLVG